MGKGRSPCCDKSKVKRGPWTPEEDLKLMAFIQNHGHANWRALPAQAGLLRCGKSCRLRWINYLRPDLKRGNITPHEEETIVKLHETYGNKWSKIASFLPGRTDNEIKNVWNTHIMKKLGIKCVRSQGSKRKKSSQDSTPSPTSSSVSHADEVDRDGKTTASLSDSKVHEMIILGEDEHGESPTPSLTSCISNVMTSKEHGIGQMDTSIDMSLETMNLDGFGALDESTFHPTHDDFDGLDFWNTLALDNLCPIQGIHIEDNASKAGEGSTSSGFGDNEPSTNNVEPENWVKYLEIELGLDA